MHASLPRRVFGTMVLAGLALSFSLPASAASLSAKQTVLNAIAATESATSVTYAGQITQGGQRITLNVSGSVSGSGQGVIGIGSGTATVRAIGGTVYFMGSNKFWTQQSGKAAAQLFTGKWVSTAATSSSGKSLAEFLNSGSFLKELFGANPGSSTFKFAGSATVGGHRTTVVAGSGAGSQAGGKLYISKGTPPYILKISIKAKTGTGSITFSKYNVPVHPVAPSNAIDLDTLNQE